MFKLIDAWRRGKRIRLRIESEKGQAIVILVLAIVGLLGFTALAIDGGNAYYIRRNMQNAADAAVVAGLQAYLSDVNDDTTTNAEKDIVLAAHAEAELNSVEDSDATPDNCVNTNVYIWYINSDGNVLDASTGTLVTPEKPPSKDDGYSLTGTSCSDFENDVPSTISGGNGEGPGNGYGLFVLTFQQFDTFIAGMIGQPTLAAEGTAGGLIKFDENGCGGTYAAFGLGTASSGSVQFTGSGPNQFVDINGDLYASGDFGIGGSVTLRVDGTFYYEEVDPTHPYGGLSNSTSVWIGPLLEIPDAEVTSAGCAALGADWTFFDPGGANPLFCYKSGAGYTLPVQTTIPDNPMTLDTADWAPGGQWADDAAGCDTSSGGGCSTSTVSICGKNWTKYGNDYYAYASGSQNFTINCTMPTGVFYFPSDAGDVSDAPSGAVVNEYTTLVHASTTKTIHFTHGVYADPSDANWKPYGGYEGSGVAIYANAGGNAFQASGSYGADIEGVIYAPNGDCQISGSISISGATVCQTVDFAGSTGTITFNLSYCQPPTPSISFSQ